MGSQGHTEAGTAVSRLREQLHASGYLADEALATSTWLARALERPLLLEGDAGVGKTALAAAIDPACS